MLHLAPDAALRSARGEKEETVTHVQSFARVFMFAALCFSTALPARPRTPTRFSQASSKRSMQISRQN
jgi:hypothetical protein